MNKNTKQKPNVSAIIVIIAVILISMLSETVPYYMLIPMIVGIVFMAVMAIVLVNAAKKMASAQSSGKVNTKQTYTKPDAKHEEAKHYDFSVERKQGKYSAYDHDTAHRLEQLDSFLKNGIIDKKEYKLLKERYMRGE